MKRFPILLFLLGLAVTADFAQNPKSPVLPKIFAGWERTADQTSSDPAKADPVYPELLKEYGFTDFESATYVRSGHVINMKAARFADASGAYGAFTFYKTPDMLTEKIGDQAASLGKRVLFYRGNVLVEVTLDEVTPMSAGQLREMAAEIALPAGPSRNLPITPAMLPRQGYVPNSVKYVMGPIALSRIGSPISPDGVDFSKGAELVQAQYRTGDGIAKLSLVSYPTPAIAGERLQHFESVYGASRGGVPGTPASASRPFFAKRTGPVVVVVSGSISGSEAKSLLTLVNYDTDVTWNQNTFFDRKNNLGNLLFNIILLVIFILVMATVAGLAFGGLRLITKRLFPDRVFDRSADVEIIRLNIGK